MPSCHSERPRAQRRGAKNLAAGAGSRLLLLLLLLAPAGVLGAQGNANPHDLVFDEVMGLHSAAHPGYAVSGLTLERDAASFMLESGQIYLLGPVGGRVAGAVFTGRGTFRFSPPIEVERGHLARQLKSPVLERSFDRLFLLFADSTGDELAGAPGGAGGRAPLPGRTAGVVRKGLEYVSNRGRRYLRPDIFSALVNREASEFFYAMVDGADGGPFLFTVDPDEIEEVSLAVGKSGPSFTDSRSEEVSRFHRARDYAGDNWAPAADRKERFAVRRYVVDATIAGNMDFRSSTTMQLEWFGPSREWFVLYLLPDLRLDSARWSDGQAATAARGRDASAIWIRRPAVEPGAPWPDLTMHYSGDLLEAEGLWVSLKSPTGWYPRPDGGYGAPVTATFDLTFHTPRSYSFASVGTRTERVVTGNVLTTRWVTGGPAAHASFTIGKFDEHEMQGIRGAVTVLINQEAHDRMPGAVQGPDGRVIVIPRQARMKETVGEDVLMSLAFFHSAFGEPPVNTFSAAEILGGHGQAFPGLIHFSWATYQGFVLARGEDEAFRSHEVAHQWWGLGVGPQTYRDAWLSEGFATFAGWWYTESVMPDVSTFEKMMERSREALLRRRHDAGPIWLGVRLAGGNTPEDYGLVVYDKGAWVLRMLRALMRDGETGDAAFTGMLRDFYRRYRGTLASTEDFRAVVEEHFGTPMDWFFDSWVYGTGIPSYEWSWNGQTDANGAAALTLRVDQRDVPEDFAMALPFRIEMEGGQEARARLMVRGARTERTFTLPARPTAVRFNELDVLADVKEVRWR